MVYEGDGELEHLKYIMCIFSVESCVFFTIFGETVRTTRTWPRVFLPTTFCGFGFLEVISHWFCKNRLRFFPLFLPSKIEHECPTKLTKRKKIKKFWTYDNCLKIQTFHKILNWFKYSILNILFPSNEIHFFLNEKFFENSKVRKGLQHWKTATRYCNKENKFDFFLRYSPPPPPPCDTLVEVDSFLSYLLNRKSLS